MYTPQKTSLWGSSEYTERSMRHWINVGTGCVCNVGLRQLVDYQREMLQKPVEKTVCREERYKLLRLYGTTFITCSLQNVHVSKASITSMTSSTCRRLVEEQREMCQKIIVQ